MIREEHIKFLKRAVVLSQQARNNGNTPFGALLVDQNGSILLEQENIEITKKICTGHAETTLAERASHLYDKEFLWNCTLYTTGEPCAMCAGSIYWSNIGNLVFGITEKKLLELTGNNKQNPTFDLPCREIFDRGQKKITIIGPVSQVSEMIMAVHKGFWDLQQFS